MKKGAQVKEYRWPLVRAGVERAWRRQGREQKAACAVNGISPDVDQDAQGFLVHHRWTSCKLAGRVSP